MSSPAAAKQSTECPNCGSQVLSEVAFGLCPRCLLGLGLPGNDSDVVEAAPEAVDFTRSGDGFDYELLERIGRGGMGVVYRARQRSLDRVVALKRIAMGDSATPAELARFRREAEMAARLDHPNIVSIIEVGEFQANPFLVMRLVEGDSLSGRLAELALPGEAKGAEAYQCQRRIAELIVTVARAVDFAHSRGVLHRDLKPSNILIDEEGRPHLTDFGIAKSLDQDTSLTQTAELLGTLGYMSPEQAAGKATSRAADIYSLGAILYELLTRQRPFEGAKVEVLRRVLETEPVPPRAIHPGIERDLATICLKCLDKNPVRRYASALALAEDLERWLRREPIVARQAGPVIRLKRWCARNPAVATLLVTLSAGMVVSLMLLARANEEQFRKSIALDILRTESARQLQEMWNSTNSYFAIKSETLSAMAGMEVSSLVENEHRFTIALFSEGNPLARVLRAAPMLNQIEGSMSELIEESTRFDLRLYKDPLQAIEDLAARKVDFAQLNARLFIRARERDPEISALLRIVPADQDYATVIFARRNRGLESLGDLRGHSILLPGIYSTMSFWTKAFLAQAGVRAAELEKFRYIDRPEDFSNGGETPAAPLGNPYSLATPIEAVLAGHYDAAVVRARRFNEVAAEHGLVALRQFDDSGELLVARGDLERKVTGAFRRVLLNQDASTGGPLLLNSSAWLRPAREEDYNAVLENLDAEEAFQR